MNIKPNQFTFEDAELVHVSIYLANRRNFNIPKTVGKKFGKLTVLPYIGRRPNRNELFYLTLCDCGKESLKTAYDLQKGVITSCGCKRAEKNIYYSRVSEDGNQSFKYGGQRHYTNVKRGALQRSLTFDLSLEDFRSLIVEQQCYYCTNPATGLDRISSDAGYELWNLVPCCKVCNRMKGPLNEEQFLGIIQQIYTKHFATSGKQ